MQKMFFVQLFAVKKNGTYQYRSAIFPVGRAMQSALFCEKWHKDESEVVQVLEGILRDEADVAEVLSKTQSFAGWLGKLGLRDEEAVLLGWRPELWGDEREE